MKTNQICQLDKEKASQKFKQLQNKCLQQINPSFFTQKRLPTFLSHFRNLELKQPSNINQFHELFSMLYSIPKGILQHIHLVCCQDDQFLQEHIFKDKRIYVNFQSKKFSIGTQQQYKSCQNWVNVHKYIQDNGQIDQLKKITMFNPSEVQQCLSKSESLWPKFQSKIFAFLPLLAVSDILKKYLVHVFSKFIGNGYQRIQPRAALVQLKQYDADGNLIKQHTGYEKYVQIFQEAIAQAKLIDPQFTVGVIIMGMKMFPREKSLKMLTQMINTKWNKIVGIDFVQEQDIYGPLSEYDSIIQQILIKFPQYDIKKVYHAGQTKNHKNPNIQYAILNGSYRIGHGINLMQHPNSFKQMINRANICFQKCPISNVFLEFLDDFRLGTAPIFHEFGIPVTINPDDPGIFGYKDSTADYYISSLSYNWSLKDFIKIGYNSIKYGLVHQQIKQKMLESYNQKVDRWLKTYQQK